MRQKSDLMREFGSDFHFVYSPYTYQFPLEEYFRIQYYANGRHAIQALIRYKLFSQKWKRIWLPEYFCYQVVDAIKQTGICTMFYADHPLLVNDDAIIAQLPFENGDVLLRMNYFGLRSWRDNTEIPIEVIEDHSHDFLSSWAFHSNADYCIVSLRKTLPLTEGGILWSPLAKDLPFELLSTETNEMLSSERLNAMLLKKMYLEKKFEDKDYFRKKYIDTEQRLDCLALSGISSIDSYLLKHIDVEFVYQKKRKNWRLLTSLLKKEIEYLLPENLERSTPFSLIMNFDSDEKRERFRSLLIKNQIYPALLWVIPDGHKNVNDKLHSLLSIHCDVRYLDRDIEYLALRMNDLL